jgi:hypothetical protein
MAPAVTALISGVAALCSATSRGVAGRSATTFQQGARRCPDTGRTSFSDPFFVGVTAGVC